MKIGIDARLIHETGVGRYIRNLIVEIARQDTTNTYVVFLRKDAYDTFLPPNKRWKKICTDIPWHSVSEQIGMPIAYGKQHLDLVHIPYHNPPIFYPGRFVVTIHDVTILRTNTGKATTLPMPIYRLKRMLYWLLLAVSLRRACRILAVSETTKKELLSHFSLDPNKIIVTYEGVDAQVGQSRAGQTPLISSPYVLYVGNAYPHKNIEVLLTLAHEFHRTVVLVGGDDIFYRRLRTKVARMNLSSSVIFFGKATDIQLANLYAHATAFVFPSKMEGFGLPALEALSHRCPLVVSDIPVFHEILGDVATFVDTSDARSIEHALAHLKKPKEERVRSLLSTYSWERMAKQTTEIYEGCTRL